MIAEYTLTSDEPLHWIWLEHGPIEGPGRCCGTFEGLGELTSLCRVSQQIHNETARLVFKLNKFEFDEVMFGDAWSHGPYRAFVHDSDALSHVYRFFLRVAGPDTTRFLKSITFKLSFSYYSNDFEAIQKLAEATPNACLKIWHRYWDLVRLDEFLPEWSEDIADEYMATTQHLQSSLASYSLVVERKWRVYPMGGHRDHLRKHLQGADLAKALAWEANGL